MHQNPRCNTERFFLISKTDSVTFCHNQYPHVLSCAIVPLGLYFAIDVN